MIIFQILNREVTLKTYFNKIKNEWKRTIIKINGMILFRCFWFIINKILFKFLLKII